MAPLVNPAPVDKFIGTHSDEFVHNALISWADSGNAREPRVAIGPQAADRPLRLLALGDSLTAGYNLPAEDAFPVKLQAALRKEGYAVEVVNAGVSGDTSTDGRARLDWALGETPPDAAIVELGANDVLRGIDPALTYTNLDAILAVLRARHVRILLAGMMAPRNMGADYVKAFDAIYPKLQAKYHVPLYPYFLDGVTFHADRTLADGMHPNPAGVAVMVAGILPQVRALLGPPPGGPSP